MKMILLIYFIFDPTYFLIASSHILKNDAILINHGSFFKEKDSPQLDRFQFLKMNSLMEEIIKKQSFLFQNSPSIIILLFLKAKLSIFASGLIFVDQLP